jgi:hypothetical protein
VPLPQVFGKLSLAYNMMRRPRYTRGKWPKKSSNSMYSGGLSDYWLF